MFQTFDDTTTPQQGPPRLKALRQELEKAAVDGVLVPRADAHQGEYVAECDAALAWLTGFTGSAGFCIALKDIAGVFVDGRYRVQVKEQVDLAHFTPVPWPEVKPAAWLREHLSTGKIAYDPWLFTKSQIDDIEADLKGSGVTLEATRNLVNTIWGTRPAKPNAKVDPYPIELSGKPSPQKREDIAQILREAGHRAAILTLPDSICWLLNIRGTDIPRIPIVQCFAVIHDTAKVDLFIDQTRVAELGPDPDINIHAPDRFEHVISKLDAPLRVDAQSAPIAVTRILKEAHINIAYAEDPCILPKACKNATEIEGARSAHLRDATAVVNFLAWLDAQKAGLTEIEVVTSLERFRADTNALRDISFDTISGAGPNGAIVHYRCTTSTNRAIQDGELFLIDSGGQYADGTTDITRTVVFGAPTREQQECYTLVLQGMIALAMARFPRGVSGRDLDALARAPLWRHGFDYDHGTGHGVGAYLSVHEGPARISRASEVPLKPGMILSDEPGYYREGAFGIRIENLIVVQNAPPLGDKRDQLNFETLTWVPFDRRLIAVDLLSPAERAWIDNYHAQIAAKLDVQGATLDWLKAATKSL